MITPCGPQVLEREGVLRGIEKVKDLLEHCAGRGSERYLRRELG